MNMSKIKSLALIPLVAGVLFGTGLLLSGMADPGKVIAFLDFAGNWDPSLAFVMGGAIGVGLIAFTRAKKMSCSWLDAPLQWPSAKHIDWRLLAGSSIFGIGWGLRYAVSDFVGMFYQAGIMDDEGNVIHISRENVKLQDRPYQVCYVQ